MSRGYDGNLDFGLGILDFGLLFDLNLNWKGV
jgi:hypothetical protein